MPKMKTNRAAAKRFKRTATGKIRRYRSYGNHLMTSKSPARRRRLRQSAVIDKADVALINAMIPYVKKR